MVPGPGLQMHNDGEIEADGERPNNCHAVRMAYVLRPFPLSSPAYPQEAGARRKTHNGSRWAEQGEDYLEWAYSSMVSSAATTEMLQPTKEMYSRGTRSSAGTGSPESCYRAKGVEGLKHRNAQLSLGSARDVSQTSVPNPFPTAQPSPALNEAIACTVVFVTHHLLKAHLSQSTHIAGVPTKPEPRLDKGGS